MSRWRFALGIYYMRGYLCQAPVRSWLPEAKGYVAEKEAHSVDYGDPDGLRVR